MDEKLDSQDLEWWPQGWGLKVRDDVCLAAQRNRIGLWIGDLRGPRDPVRGRQASPGRDSTLARLGKVSLGLGSENPERPIGGLWRARGLAPTRPGTRARCAGRCVGLQCSVP